MAERRKRAKVPGMTRLPKVAPFESCVGCFRGDVATAVHLEGHAEFIVAGVHRLAGLTTKEASATLEAAWGTDRGMVPAGRTRVVVRLCDDCAAKTGARLGPADPAEDEVVFTYVGPTDEE